MQHVAEDKLELLILLLLLPERWDDRCVSTRLLYMLLERNSGLHFCFIRRKTS